MHDVARDETRQNTERVEFQGLYAKLCTTNFVKNLALMADVLSELRIHQKLYKTVKPHFQRLTTYHLCVQSK